MEEKKAYQKAGEIVEELGGDLYKERNRGYASEHEAWAEIKESIERLGDTKKKLESLETALWTAAKEGNDNAFLANLGELKRTARNGAWDLLVLAGKATLAEEHMGGR